MSIINQAGDRLFVTIDERCTVLSNLIEHVSDSIISTDLNANIIAWNKGAEKTYGYTAKEVTGKPLGSIIKYTYLDDTEENAYKKLMELGIWKGEVMFVRNDGAKLYLQASVSLIKSDSGKLAGIVAVNRNITDRKKAEKALLESEARFRFLSENIRDLICLHAPDGGMTYVSPSVTPVLGYIPQELSGKKLADLSHHEDRERIEKELHADSWKENTGIQFRVLKKDGTYKWLETIIQPIFDENNKVVSFQTSSRDITSRKTEELALRTKELEFRTLAENAPVIIQRMNAAFCYMYCNSTFEKFFNLPCAYIIGKTPGCLGLSEKELDTFTHAAEAVFALGKSSSITMELTGPDNIYSCFHTTIVPEFDEMNEVSSILVISSDITDIKNKDEALRAKEAELIASNERFTLAARATTDAMWEINLKTRSVFVSEEFISKFGYTETDIKGQPDEWFISKIHNEHRDAVLQKNLRALELREPFWKDEFRWQCKDGLYKYILNQASIFYDDDSRPYRAIGAIQDITERKNIEAQLQVKDRLLSAVAVVSNTLQVEQDIHKSMDICLALIGESAGVDRIVAAQYLQDNERDKSTLRRKYEWNAGTFKQHSGNNKSLPLPETKMPEVIELLKSGNIINTLVSAVSNNWLQEHLVSNGIRSILAIPVLVNENLWGIICFEQCSYDRFWTPVETDILKTFSASVAGAIARKEADQKLKDSEEKLKALFQNSLDIVFVTDKKSTIKYVTPSIEKVLGFPACSVANKKGTDYIHPDDTKKLKKEFKCIIADPECHAVIDLRVTDSKGKWIWMEAKAQNKLLDPNINGIILSLRDITERKHAQQILTEYSETITGILNSITDGFATVDKAFKIKLWNKVAEKLTMVKNEEIVGKNLWEQFPELIDSTIHVEFIRVLSTNTTGNFEQYVRSLNRWFDVTVYPYEDGLFIYFKEVTARKRQEILLEIEKDVLQVNADQLSNLKSTVDFFLKSIRKINHDVLCSVVLLDDNKKSVHVLSAPDLSPQYAEAMNNIIPALHGGSCTEAMLTRQQITVPNITTDRFWVKHSDIATRHAITACCSIPIINIEDQVIGCLECYFEKDKTLPAVTGLLSRLANLLRIIIETKMTEDKTRIINDRYILAVRATSEAVWDWDITANILYGGEEFYRLFGYKSNYKINASNFWDKHIHGDDRERVSNGIREFIAARSPDVWMEEYRLKRSDGNYAVVVNKGCLVAEKKNKILRMIGSIADVTEKRHLEKKYIKQEVDKQKLMAMAVVNAQENERAKIGRELHDSVNQVLSTAKLFLEVAKTNSKDRMSLIGKSADQIRDAINEIRQISQSLVPPIISDLGLTESIKDLVENIAVTKTLKVDYHNIGDIENSMSDNQKLMFFRIIQEQVNNVLKHAGATHLLIQLMVNDTEIELKITDDGKGFDPDQLKLKKGVGLSNISSRVELFNGKLKIISSPGKGCKLIVKVVRILK